MKTAYKITVAHEDGFDPDMYVDALEIVVNRLAAVQGKDLTATEWLAEIVAQVGRVAATQLEVSDILKGADPHAKTPDQIFAYLDSLIDLCAVSILSLSSLTTNIRKEQHETYELKHDGMGQDSSESP